MNFGKKVKVIFKSFLCRKPGLNILFKIYWSYFSSLFLSKVIDTQIDCIPIFITIIDDILPAFHSDFNVNAF